MKGIILAGGLGTRMDPATRAVSKQLLPIYDTPIVFHPLTLLLRARIREILVISTPRDLPLLRDLLGSGETLGIALAYEAQVVPRGIADALMIAGPWLDREPCCLVLGDNLFFGPGLDTLVAGVSGHHDGAVVYTRRVRDPRPYAVVSLDRRGTILSIEEKPQRPRSRLAAVGLYLYDGEAAAVASTLTPSGRGEIEITDLNRRYLERGRLAARRLGRRIRWIDAGTPERILEATRAVRALERRTGERVACPEIAAYRSGFIDGAALSTLARVAPETGYRRALAAEAIRAGGGRANEARP